MPKQGFSLVRRLYIQTASNRQTANKPMDNFINTLLDRVENIDRIAEGISENSHKMLAPIAPTINDTMDVTDDSMALVLRSFICMAFTISRCKNYYSYFLLAEEVESKTMTYNYLQHELVRLSAICSMMYALFRVSVSYL